MSEAELIARCRSGDQQAFAELFHRYRLPAWRLACAVTGDEDLADDAAQEAFVKAFRSLDNLRPGLPFGPWFYAIVANRARRLAVRRRWWRWLPLAAAERQPDPAAGGAIAAAAGQLTVRAAVRQLPVDLRTVVALRYVLDLDEQQMAGMLGIPAGTVKSRLYRARQQLQRLLGDDGEEGPCVWPAVTK